MVPCFERYPAPGGNEWMLRIGDRKARQVLLLPPLLHEGARTRTFIVGIMRRIAAAGWGCALPDLPGLGESSRSLPGRLTEWQQAVAAAGRAVDACCTLAIRSGALFDAIVPPAHRWRFSPAGGAALIRDLARAAAIASAEAGRREAPDAIATRARSSGALLAGYALSPALVQDLEASSFSLAAGRTIRLVGDDRPADARVPGTMPWRSAEPDPFPLLAESLAADFIVWAETCVSF